MVEKRMNQHIPPSASERGLTQAARTAQWDKSQSGQAMKRGHLRCPQRQPLSES